MSRFFDFFAIFLVVGGVIFGFVNIIANVDELTYDVDGNCVTRVHDDRSLYHDDRLTVTKYCEVK